MVAEEQPDALLEQAQRYEAAAEMAISVRSPGNKADG
jgi:hypothetical protein